MAEKSQIFAGNVLKILRHTDTSIGNFEAAHNISTGYLSRLAKGSRYITLDLAMWLAEDLGMDVYKVLNTNWDEVYAEEDKKHKREQIELEIARLQAKLKEIS